MERARLSYLLMVKSLRMMKQSIPLTIVPNYLHFQQDFPWLIWLLIRNQMFIGIPVNRVRLFMSPKQNNSFLFKPGKLYRIVFPGLRMLNTLLLQTMAPGGWLAGCLLEQYLLHYTAF